MFSSAVCLVDDLLQETGGLFGGVVTCKCYLVFEKAVADP